MAEVGLLASVVVAVKGDHRVLRLLDSLVNQTVPSDVYEVIVVENGSSDLVGIGGLCGGIVRYLHAPQANMAVARGIGLAAARGRYLLLTDADCVAEPDWIEKMTARLAEGSVAAVGGVIGKYEPTTWTQRYAITVVDGQRTVSYLPALHLPYVAGANAGFVTEKLRDVGGFDDELRSGNDVDVCYKLGLHGYSVGLAPDAVVRHEDRAGLVGHFRRFQVYAVYQVLLYAKYKHVSDKSFVLDTYPFRRAWQALSLFPTSIVGLARGDAGPARRAVLQLVEAAGVLCGEIQGSIRYRQMYL